MKQILFVDDDPVVIAVLQRSLRGMQAEWQMSFAENGRRALEIMAAAPMDVVVTDTLTPSMSGTELLTQVAQAYPSTVRIVLSGRSQHEKVLNMLGPAHQYLSKPCRPEQLRDSVNRAFAMQHLLTSDPLRRVVTQLQGLPSLPARYMEMLDELRQEEPSLEKLAELIGQDPGLCTKLVRLVNSPAFALPQMITDPLDAIMHLGLTTVKSIVISLQLFSVFDTVKIQRSGLDDLWRHCWQTGLLAQRLAELEKVPGAEHALICGLVHDLGKLVLLTGLATPYQAILGYSREHRIPLCIAEKEFLGATHAEVGGYMLALWGLPVPVIEAVAFHHRPGEKSGDRFNLASVLHVANAFANRTPGQPLEAVSTLDRPYLERLGFQDCLPEWEKQLSDVRSGN